MGGLSIGLGGARIAFLEKRSIRRKPGNDEPGGVVRQSAPSAVRADGSRRRRGSNPLDRLSGHGARHVRLGLEPAHGEFGPVLHGPRGTPELQADHRRLRGLDGRHPGRHHEPLVAGVANLLRPTAGNHGHGDLGGRGRMFLVAGHPQFLYYTVLLGGSYVLMHVVAEGRRREWRKVGRQMLCLLTGTALAVGVAAPLLISLVTDRELITRSSADYAFFLGEHHLQPNHLLTFLYPEWLGTPVAGSYPGDELWEDVAYFGLIPLILAFVGVVIGWARLTTRWLVAAAAICLLLAADTPIGRSFFDWLPFYALFFQPNRFLFFVSLSGIALAGIAVDELLLRWRVTRPRKWVVVAACVGVILVMTAEGSYYARRYVTMRPRSEVIPRTSLCRFLRQRFQHFPNRPRGALDHQLRLGRPHELAVGHGLRLLQSAALSGLFRSLAGCPGKHWRCAHLDRLH